MWGIIAGVVIVLIIVVISMFMLPIVNFYKKYLNLRRNVSHLNKIHDSQRNCIDLLVKQNVDYQSLSSYDNTV